jgi:hypothetical protein
VFGFQVIPIVDLNLVTEAGEQVFPIIGWAVVQSKSAPICRTYKRWNVNGKVGAV